MISACIQRTFSLDGNQTQHTHTHTLNQYREELFWEYNRMTDFPS